MSGFNGIGDLYGTLDEEAVQAPQVVPARNGSSVASAISRGMGAPAVKQSGGRSADAIPWAWVVGAVVLTGVAAYFVLGGGVKFQNPIQFNPPPRRKKRKNPPRRRKSAKRAEDDSDDKGED